MQIKEGVIFSLDIAILYKKFHSVLCARFQVMEMDRNANPRELTIVKTPGGPHDAVVAIVLLFEQHPKTELARGVPQGIDKVLPRQFYDRNRGRMLCRVGRKLVCARVVCRPLVRTHGYGQKRGILLEQSIRALLRKCLAFDAVTACHVADITMRARERPETPATEVCPERDIHLLHTLLEAQGHRGVERMERGEIPTIQSFVINLGRLVGAHPTKRQPRPGVKKVWQGLERLNWGIQVRDAIGEKQLE